MSDNHTDALILREDHESIATLTLNRPNQFNALSRAMLDALYSALEQIDQDDSVRVVIIAAQGKAFSAGHDLKEMRSCEDLAFHQDLFQHCGNLMLLINRLRQPVIAQVQGIATAAGCQLVANCDLAVAGDHSRFAVSGINLGLFCSTPSVPLSRNIGRKQALRMLLTGDFVSATDAQQMGLVNEIVTPEDLAPATLALARKIAAKPSVSITLGKKMFYQQLDMSLEQAYTFAAEQMACNMDSDAAREGIDAFIEKRKPNWS